MRAFAAALLLCLAPAAGAAPLDVYSLELEYLVQRAVAENPQGSELASTLKGRGKLPPLCLDVRNPAGGRDGGAYYYDGRICFDLARVMRFYNRAGDSPGDLDWYSMSRQMGTMRELAAELAPDYYHELVHSWQYLVVRAGPLPSPESEYEAYLRTALFFNEQVKANPVLLTKQAAEPSYGGRAEGHRVSANASDYFALCGGRKAYFAGLDALYGGRGAAGVEAAGAAYAAGVRRLVDRAWPALWKDAALNGGRAALGAGAYPLALRCLLPDPAEVRACNLPKADESAVYSEGERALAFALIKLRAGPGRDFDEYAGLFRAVEEAHARLNRALPADLAAKRPEVYERASKYYSEAAALEKDKRWRAYLRAALKYFSR